MDLLRKYAFVLILLATNWQLPLGVKGLDCDICWRLGDFGSRSCDRMPCNSREELEEAARTTDRHFVDASAAAAAKGMLLLAPSEADLMKLTYHPDLKFSCLKILAQVGKDGEMFEFTKGMCTYYYVLEKPINSSQSQTGSLSPPSYNEPPTMTMADMYKKGGLNFVAHSVNLCDEKSVDMDSCRISEEELNRGGSWDWRLWWALSVGIGAAIFIIVCVVVVLCKIFKRRQNQNNLDVSQRPTSSV